MGNLGLLNVIPGRGGSIASICKARSDMKSLLQSMISSLVAGIWIVLVLLIDVMNAESTSVTFYAAKPMPADEAPGPRPYEMVWAGY